MNELTIALPALNELSKIVNEINRANGWEVIAPDDLKNNKYKLPAVLMLIVSELAEGLEDYRGDNMDHFGEECADVIIRMLDLTGGLGINIETAIYNKLEKNKTRGYRHGGKKV